MKKILAITFLCFLTFTVAGQSREVASSKVPSVSTAWVKDAFTKVGKVKWYQLQRSEKTIYEARFKHKGNSYWAEFTASGEIANVKKKIKWAKVDEGQKARLYLNFSQISKFDMIEIREHWTAPSSSDLIQAIIRKNPKLATIRYEIDFNAEIDGEQGPWKGLFDQDGQLLSMEVL